MALKGVEESVVSTALKKGQSRGAGGGCVAVIVTQKKT